MIVILFMILLKVIFVYGSTVRFWVHQVLPLAFGGVPLARALCDLKLWSSIFAPFGRLFVFVLSMTFLLFLEFFWALIYQSFSDDSPAINLIFFFQCSK